jgi:hypothetical protein
MPIALRHGDVTNDGAASLISRLPLGSAAANNTKPISRSASPRTANEIYTAPARLASVVPSNTTSP